MDRELRQMYLDRELGVEAVTGRAFRPQFAPPAEAALQAGFADQSHFNRLFKPLIGLPPGQYRAAFQAGKEQT